MLGKFSKLGNKMPWCPKCRTEYREGFTICSDCNVKLVSILKKDKNYDSTSLLVTVNDNFIAKSIEDLLKSKNIPVYIKSDRYLEVIMGASKYNIDIYIPDALINKAKKIIKNELFFDLSQNNNNLEKYSINDKFKKSLKKRTWIIILFFYFPGAFLLLALIIFMIHTIFYD